MDGFDDTRSRSLGQVIRQRRRELGITQEELAERVGGNVRQSDISRLERGGVGLPRRARLEAIADALEVSPGYLLLHSNWFGNEETVVPDIIDPGSLPSTRQAEEPAGDVPDDRPDAAPETSDVAQAISRAQSRARRIRELLDRSSRMLSGLEPPAKQD